MRHYLAVLIVLATSLAHATQPEWFIDGNIQMHGQLGTFSCKADGPDQSTASRLALSQCRSTAVERVKGYAFKNSSFVIEDEKQAKLYSETSSELQVTGLQGDVVRQKCQDRNEDAVTCYLSVQFDLSKAKIIEAGSSELIQDKDGDQEQSIVQNKGALGLNAKEGAFAPKEIIYSENRQLSISVLPPCVSLFVRGGTRPRTIRCSQNPVSLLVFPDDGAIHIYGPKGFKSKTIKLNGRTPASNSSAESISVYLERF